MALYKNKGLYMGIICVLVAMVCRQIKTANQYLATFFFLLRALSYLTLYVSWGFSIYKRVLNRAIRNCIVLIAFLMVYWMFTRTIKYFAPAVMNDMTRLLWYMYYIPIILIPTINLFLALYMRKEEEYQLPKSFIYVLTSLALVLIFLVLTNDFHQLVFSFPEGLTLGNNIYKYKSGYYLIVFFDAICLFVALFCIYKRCRIYKSNRYIWMPFAVVIISVVYTIASIFRPYVWKVLCGDITSSFCLLYIMLLESLVLAGLIPVNTSYKELFIASTATMLISDNDDNLIYHSKNMKASEVNHDDLLKAKIEPVIINNISRLSSKPIRGGYIYWLEDIKELLSNLKELEDSKDELKDANIVEQENIKAKKELERLRVNNQIYDLVLNQTKNQSHVLANLLDMYKKENDHSQKIAILGKILVIGTYLKRKSNLIIISYQNKTIDANELALCIKESIRSLDACNKNSSFVFKLDGYIEKEKAMLIYDLFEYVIESCFDRLETLLVIVKKENDELNMQINIEYDGNLEEIITDNNLLLSRDFDGCYVVSFRCKEDKRASV